MKNYNIEKDIYPLSDSQKLLLWSQIFTFEPKAVKESNILSFYFIISENCSLKALEEAFNLVVKNNDSLRLKIFTKFFKYYQYIKDFQYENLNIVTLKGRNEFQNYLNSIKQHSLPLTGDKLLWAELVDMGQGSGALVIRFHHVCIDGYSISLLIKELGSYYKAFYKGEYPSLRKTHSITTFLQKEKEYKGSQKYLDDKKYWKYTYNHQRNYSFPAGKRAIHGSADSSHCFIEKEMYDKLRNVCHEHSCSVQFSLMAVAALTVNKLTGEDNFAIYSLTHGRNTYPLKQTLGCMMNTVPIFFDINLQESFKSYLDTQYINYLDTLDHGRFPMGDQVPLSYKEPIRHYFNFNHGWLLFSAMDFGKEIHNSSFEPSLLTSTNIPHQFYCAILEVPGEYIKISLTYQKKKFNATLIGNILDTYKKLLGRCLSEPEKTIKDIIIDVNE